jgi:8-oxoguanine deaminase
VAALILCQPDKVDYGFINGRKVVDEGRLAAADLETLVESTNAAALSIARRMT